MAKGEQGRGISPTAPTFLTTAHSPALLSPGGCWANLVLGGAQPGQMRPSPEQTILKYR